MSGQLSVRLFATLRDRAGQSRIDIPFDQPASVATLLDRVADRHPELAPILPSSLVAVNRDFADGQTLISLGDEVALFPPVSGG